MELPRKKYLSIGHASRLTGIKPHVLRYWESEFKLLSPTRRESGQRRYTHKDIEKILYVKDLLYNQKYSISGAKKKLLAEARRIGPQLKMELEKDTQAIAYLKKVKKQLLEILKLLK